MATRFKNFQAISRKPNLINFGLFPSTANLDWIDGTAIEIVETPLVGTQNGVNLTFQCSSLKPVILKNGLVQREGAGNDYTVNNRVVTFAIAPQADDWLLEIAGGSDVTIEPQVVSWLPPSTAPDGIRTYFVFPQTPKYCNLNGLNQYLGTGYTIATVGGEIRVTFIDVSGNPIAPDAQSVIREAI